jgi:predicted GNAT family acetyltransferase
MAFRDNRSARRFELSEAGGMVFADYRRHEGWIDVRHVETPAALRGRGAATRLMDAIVALARAEVAARLKLRALGSCAVVLARLRRVAELRRRGAPKAGTGLQSCAPGPRSRRSGS